MFGCDRAASRTRAERACFSAASAWAIDGAAAGAAPAAPVAPSLAQAEAAEKQARSARVREAARAHPNIREAAKILEGGIEDVDEL